MLVGLSCKENKKFYVSGSDNGFDSDSIKSVSAEKYFKPERELNDYVKIDTNVCIYNSRLISPIIGYLKISGDIPTVKIETYFDTTMILEV